MADSCEHSNDPPGFVKYVSFFVADEEVSASHVRLGCLELVKYRNKFRGFDFDCLVIYGRII